MWEEQGAEVRLRWAAEAAARAVEAESLSMRG